MLSHASLLTKNVQQNNKWVTKWKKWTAKPENHFICFIRFRMNLVIWSECVNHMLVLKAFLKRSMSYWRQCWASFQLFFLSFKLFIVSRRSFCIATHTSQFFSHTFLLAPWTLYNTIITFRLFDQFFCREKLWRENCNWFKTSFCEKKNNFNWQTTTLFTLFILFAF